MLPSAAPTPTPAVPAASTNSTAATPTVPFVQRVIFAIQRNKFKRVNELTAQKNIEWNGRDVRGYPALFYSPTGPREHVIIEEEECETAMASIPPERLNDKRIAKYDERTAERVSAFHITRQINTLFLVEHGTDIDARDNDGRTLLMVAIEKRDFVMVRLAINLGADVRAKNKKGETVLIYAAKHDVSADLLSLVIPALQIPPREIKSASPPSAAAPLVSPPITVLEEDQNRHNALFYVMKRGNEAGTLELIKVLQQQNELEKLKKAIFLEQISGRYRSQDIFTSYLLLAIKMNSAKVVELLYDTEEEDEKVGYEQLRPLKAAAANPEIAKLIAEKGNLVVQDYFYAIESRHYELLLIMLDRCARDMATRKAVTSFLQTILTGDAFYSGSKLIPQVVAKLLDLGADVNFRYWAHGGYSKGRSTRILISPLWDAYRRSAKSIFPILLDAPNVDVNLRNIPDPDDKDCPNSIHNDVTTLDEMARTITRYDDENFRALLTKDLTDATLAQALSSAKSRLSKLKGEGNDTWPQVEKIVELLQSVHDHTKARQAFCHAHCEALRAPADTNATTVASPQTQLYTAIAKNNITAFLPLVTGENDVTAFDSHALAAALCSWLYVEWVGNKPLSFAAKTPAPAVRAEAAATAPSAGDAKRTAAAPAAPPETKTAVAGSVAESALEQFITAIEKGHAYDALITPTFNGNLPIHFAWRLGRKDLVARLLAHVPHTQWIAKDEAGKTLQDYWPEAKEQYGNKADLIDVYVYLVLREDELLGKSADLTRRYELYGQLRAASTVADLKRVIAENRSEIGEKRCRTIMDKLTASLSSTAASTESLTSHQGFIKARHHVLNQTILQSSAAAAFMAQTFADDADGGLPMARSMSFALDVPDKKGDIAPVELRAVTGWKNAKSAAGTTTHHPGITPGTLTKPAGTPTQVKSTRSTSAAAPPAPGPNIACESHRSSVG